MIRVLKDSFLNLASGIVHLSLNPTTKATSLMIVWAGRRYLGSFLGFEKLLYKQ